MERGHETANLCTVKMENARTRIALTALALWEAWWTYEFFSAPQPDYEMRTVFALLMGVFLPVALASLALLIRFATRSGR